MQTMVLEELLRLPQLPGKRYTQARFGGPCRGRTYGPLIKSLVDGLPEDTQQEQSAAKDEDS